MENINLQNLAQDIIDRINNVNFIVDDFIAEKFIDQKVLKEVYQIIKTKNPNFIAEYDGFTGNIRRIFKKNI